MKTALNRTPASFPVRRMDYNFEDTLNRTGFVGDFFI